MRRFRALLVVVLGSLACAGFGYAAALTMAPSTGDETAPPTGPVTARVELRRLESTVITRGDAGFADPVELVVRTSAPLPVVTAAPERRGGTVEAGEVVLEVAGRPVVALPGALPAYRDLSEGDTGPDVSQLEQALVALGLDPGDVDEELTAATTGAVRDLYERLGYEAPSGRVVLPMSEVTYVPTLPRRVDRAPARLGSPLPKVPMLLSGSELEVSIGLSAADRDVLHRGMRARVDVPGAGTVEGRLGPITTTKTGARTSLTLPRLSGRQQRALEGANVKVTVPLESTRGRVLAVPLAALNTDAGGTVRVVRVSSDGTTEAVEVEVGLSAEGYAAVHARRGELQKGDRVVVGS